MNEHTFQAAAARITEAAPWLRPEIAFGLAAGGVDIRDGKPSCVHTLARPRIQAMHSGDTSLICPICDAELELTPLGVLQEKEGAAPAAKPAKDKNGKPMPMMDTLSSCNPKRGTEVTKSETAQALRNINSETAALAKTVREMQHCAGIVPTPPVYRGDPASNGRAVQEQAKRDAAARAEATRLERLETEKRLAAAKTGHISVAERVRRERLGVAR